MLSNSRKTTDGLGDGRQPRRDDGLPPVHVTLVVPGGSTRRMLIDTKDCTARMTMTPITAISP